MKDIKKLLSYFIIGILVALSGYLFLTYKPKTISAPAVLERVQELQKLETASMRFEKIIALETNNENKIKEWLFGDKILLVAHGEVVAGIDFSKLTKEDIKINGNKIEINLPPSEVFLTRLFSDQTQVYDRQTGLLAKGDKDLETNARIQAELEIQKGACESYILLTANQNAEKQIKTLLQVLGFSEVAIKTQAGVCK